MSARIVAVDDAAETLKFLKSVLGKAGYAVDACATPGRFFDRVIEAKPDLCLVDAQLPGMNGTEIVRVLRASPETRRIPLILMAAAAMAPGDVVRGFDEGADEIFRKPLDASLLLARVANLIARGRMRTAPAGEIVSWGPLEIALDEHRATLSGKAVALTHLEMKLLLAFLRQPGRVLVRSLLLQSVWNSPATATRTVDKHVENLRHKLPPFGRKVETVVGVGYVFRP